MTSVACVDDNRLLGEALAARLGHEPDFAWLGCLSQARAVEQRLWALAPDLLLLDIDMPGLDSFSLMERVAVELPRTRILVVTGHSQPTDREHALALGAWGYVSKGISTPQLLAAMRRVMAGEVVIDEEPRPELDPLPLRGEPPLDRP